MDRVAEERALAEDHTERARLGLDAHAAGVPADVEHGHVAGLGRRRVYDAAGSGAHAVGPDQQVSLGPGPVLKNGSDAVRRARGVHEPLAVLDADAAPDRLVAQRPVEVGPFEGLAYRAVR